MLFQDAPPPFKLVVGKCEVTEIKTSYAEGAPGQAFAIMGSSGYLEIAANRAAATQMAGVGKGGEVVVSVGGAAAAGTQ